MTQSSKELVKNLFTGRHLDRTPFIPWICSYAARLEQVPVKTMLSDAGVLSKALINARKLFGYDAIISTFDSILEAEACGCKVSWPDSSSMPIIASHPLDEGKNIWDLDTSNIEKKGRIPAVLESTKRIIIINGKEVAVAGVITGPLTLAAHLKGKTFTDDLNNGSDEIAELIEETGNICLRLCRAYCELGVDMVVIAEDMLGQLKPENIKILASPLRSIHNVVAYYKAHLVILGNKCRNEHINPVFDIDADAVSLSGSIDYAQLKAKAIERNRCFSRYIPDSALLGIDPQSGKSVSELLRDKDKGMFLSTEWEVPYMTDVNQMHEIMKHIRG